MDHTGMTVALAGDQVRIQWSSPGVQATNVLIFMITLCVNAGVVTIWAKTMWNVVRWGRLAALVQPRLT